MKYKKSFVCYLVLAFFTTHTMNAAVNFGAKDSAIEIIGTGAKLNVLPASMTITEGTIKKDDSANVEGGTLSFADGIFISEKSEITLTGENDLDGSPEVSLNGGDALFKAEPGIIFQKIIVRDDRNRLEGQPTFGMANPITLQDTNATLSIGIQTNLNQNIVMNGGTLGLADDLRLNDDVKFTGSGRVTFNNHNLTFGGEELLWTDTIVWDSATHITLNNDITIRGQWIFDGDAHISGNGNALDLTNGGSIIIKAGRRLEISDIKLKGLGTGFLVFEDKTSQLRTCQAEIVMDADTTVTDGGIYVAGFTKLICKDNLLTFDGRASLTVDGTAFAYIPLEFTDQQNVRPKIVDDTNNKFVQYLNGGTVYKPRYDILGVVNFDVSATITLGRHLIISPDNRLNAESDLEIDGNTHFIFFTRIEPSLDGETVIIAAGKELSFTRCIIRDLRPDYVSFGDDDSSMIFDTRTTLEMLGGDLTYSWTFQGVCVLDGVGRTLELKDIGRIFFAPGADVTIRNITLKGVSGTNVICGSDATKLTLDNVKIVMSGDYTFGTGFVDIISPCDIVGTYTFNMNTSVASAISTCGGLRIHEGTTFRYVPKIASNALLTMADDTSEIHLKGGTLATTSTGMLLSKGTLTVDRKSFLTNVGGTSESEAIVFGTGTAADDLNVKVLPGASLSLLSGQLLYNNAS